MALPGFISIYNRFPYDFEFQSDCRQYTIPAHSAEIVTLVMAQHAVKQGIYKWSIDTNDYRTGIVPEGHEDFGNPLSREDLKLDDPLASHEVELSYPGATYEVLKVSNVDAPRRRSRTSAVTLTVGGDA